MKDDTMSMSAHTKSSLTIKKRMLNIKGVEGRAPVRERFNENAAVEAKDIRI